MLPPRQETFHIHVFHRNGLLIATNCAIYYILYKEAFVTRGRGIERALIFKQKLNWKVILWVSTQGGAWVGTYHLPPRACHCTSNKSLCWLISIIIMNSPQRTAVSHKETPLDKDRTSGPFSLICWTAKQQHKRSSHLRKHYEQEMLEKTHRQPQPARDN